MNRKALPFLLLTIMFGCTDSHYQTASGTLEKVLNQNQQVSTEEVARGLKEALNQGVSKGSAQASQVGGYYQNPLLRILIPPEMQKVNQKLRAFGFNKLMDDFELSLNRGAEEAAKQAQPIFVKAITSMTITDAWNILKGPKDAATQYLRRTTNDQLHTSFKPIIQNSLQQVQATKYYSEIITTYNRLTSQQINPNLDDYVTDKAIDGLFVLVKQEEANIRENPVARVTELLKRVFSNTNTQ